MLSVKQVIDEISNFLKAPASEPVNLLSGLGRVLSNDVHSRCMVPPFDICNVNGYAVKTSNVMELPITLKRVAKSKKTSIYKEEIKDGETVEVFAGCPVPKGADAIISKDEVEVSGILITVKEMAMEGQNISPAGIDINIDDNILKKGVVLTSRHIALADTAKLPWLPVIKEPRIGVISNVDYDNDDLEFQRLQKSIGSSIGSFLSAFINSCGAKATNLGESLSSTAPANQILSFKNELSEALQSVDMLVIIGGQSIVDENLMWTALSQQGARLTKHDVAIGGGESIIIGNKDDIPIVGLPDHHVASIICALLFLRPVINKMLNVSDDNEAKLYAILDRDLDEFDKKSDYLYGKLYENDKGDHFISPMSAQDTLMISVLTDTNCIMVMDREKELKNGIAVEVIMFTGSIVSS